MVSSEQESAGLDSTGWLEPSVWSFVCFLRVFQFSPTVQRHAQCTLIGDSKLAVGTNVSMIGGLWAPAQRNPELDKWKKLHGGIFSFSMYTVFSYNR